MNQMIHPPGCRSRQIVRLRVTDDGCGMDQHTLDNLFDPFFTTKEVGKGTGAGIVHRIWYCQAEQRVHSCEFPGESGNHVRYFLPRYSETPGTNGAGSHESVPAGNGETILVVEDESSILELLETMLEQLGYTVLAEPSPMAALNLAKARKGRVDLLITDVIMPEMNGRDLAEQISEMCPEIRLLFMSGYPADVIAEQGVLDKGFQFIQKPFSMQDIARKVHETLR